VCEARGTPYWRRVHGPRGSEIIVSQINIAPMFELIEHHGFQVVAASVDVETLQLDAREVAALITPRTRAILVAPLFGSRMNLEAIGDLAREHRLLLIEDGAQMFSGPNFRGSPAADVTFFSFGLLKTATTLGGAVVFARDH
jgi:dTDP-4-amino-4,6-dideoxygalactose transaminase